MVNPAPSSFAPASDHLPSLEKVARNAETFDVRRNLLTRRAEITRQMEEVDRHLAEIDRSLGLDRVVRVEHVAGTDSHEFLCEACRLDWVAPAKAPCPRCFPIQLPVGMGTPPREIEALWRQHTVDALRRRADSLRLEAVTAPAGLASLSDAEVVNFVKDRAERARVLDDLADDADGAKRGYWVPLPEARVFYDRTYLLCRLDANGQPSGRGMPARPDPALGWVAEEPGGEHFQRDDAGTAVFFCTDGREFSA